jgi:GH43 family beta-xylosidase
VHAKRDTCCNVTKFFDIFNFSFFSAKMNMHILYRLIVFLLVPLLQEPTFKNPVYDGADPWIFKHNDKYYSCWSAGKEIHVSGSDFLTKRGEVSIKVWSAPEKGWNRTNVWAPELHFYHGKWYIYYAAGRSGPPYIHQKTGVLISDSDDPLGTYTDGGLLYTGDHQDMKSGNRWAIDLTSFTYGNRLYAVWSGWEADALTDKTPQHLYIAEMENPAKMKTPRVRISSPVESWETGGPLDLQEGPAILMNNDNLFIVYSCRESWKVEYRLGILKLKDSSRPLTDPANWEKSGPVFTGPFGVGHCSFTRSPDEREDWIVYHSKKDSSDGWKRDVRMQPFRWGPDGYPDFGTAVRPGQEISRPSGEIMIEAVKKR